MGSSPGYQASSILTGVPNAADEACSATLRPWHQPPSRFVSSSAMSDQLPALATPAEVAHYLHTTTASLAQDRYKGTGPRFINEEDGCSTGGLTPWNGWIATLFSAPMIRDSSDERCRRPARPGHPRRHQRSRVAALAHERPTPTPAPLRSGLIGIYANAAVALCVNALGVGSLARSGIHCKSEVVEVVGELVGVDVHGRDGG